MASADHAWTVVSEHRTADGPVRYERCHCGRWRLRLAGAVLATPDPGTDRRARAESSGAGRGRGRVDG